MGDSKDAEIYAARNTSPLLAHSVERSGLGLGQCAMEGGSSYSWNMRLPWNKNAFIDLAEKF